MPTPIIPGAYGQRTGNGGSPIGGAGNLLVAVVGRGDRTIAVPAFVSGVAIPKIKTGTANPGFLTSTTVYYVITAYNDNGETIKSAEISVATPLGTSSTPQSVYLKWSQVKGAKGYKIYRGAATGVYTTPSLAVTIVGGATAYEDANGTLTTGTPPATGGALFVAYNTPTLFFNTSDLREAHGYSTTLGKASIIADRLHITNILAVSVDYTTVDAASTDEAKLAAKVLMYRAALSALELHECRLVVCMEPDPAITAVARQHALTMYALDPKMYRMVVAASGNNDTIGDGVTANTITKNISGLANHLLVMTAPNTPYLTYSDEFGNSVISELQDGSMNAVFAACLKASMTDEAEQITQKAAAVFDGYDTVYRQSEIEYLITFGACVFTQDSSGLQKCVKGITTDTSTVENNEWSIVQADFRVGTEAVAASSFAVGRKITQQLLDTVTDKEGTVLLGLKGTIITSFSGLMVTQDKVNPTWIVVKFAYRPMYSANVIMFSWSYDTKVSA